MFNGKRILAVVPARSGSKGIPGKNMKTLRGITLIGWAGKTLARLPYIDARIISTDSRQYATEGKRYGLEAPFIRPRQLSHDRAGAVETLQHALHASESYYGTQFDIILIIEPTSPLRTPSDITMTVRRLIDSRADSAVSVSVLSKQSHPLKILKMDRRNRLGFFQKSGRRVHGRQSLKDDYYYRNGICYALTRQCLVDRGAIFTKNTVAVVTPHPIANIDDPLDLAWAAFLMNSKG